MIFAKKISLNEMQHDVAYTTHVSKLEQDEIEKCFVRAFSTEDGKKVLAWLQVITFHRANGPEATAQSLHYVEGQRALVAQILRLIDRGKNK